MAKTLQVWERRREELLREMAELGDFRRGTISANYRKCGKPNCACAVAGHPGHGPQYLWNSTIKGRSVAENLRLGPALEKVIQETENYRKFLQLSQELVEVNEQICKLRPVLEPAGEQELEQLKKKLRQQFSRKQRKR